MGIPGSPRSGGTAGSVRVEAARTRFAVIAVMIAFVPGCSHAPSPSVPPSRTGDESARKEQANKGAVAMEFLPDPAGTEIKVAENQEFAPPAPRLTPLPAYPPAALEGGAGSAVVAIRLYLDAEGAVVRVTDSPRQASYDGPYATDFRQAVESAVRRWIFTAARIDTVDRSPAWRAEPGSPPPLVSTQRVPSFLDFSFRFTVVDGRGVVEMGPQAPAAKQ